MHGKSLPEPGAAKRIPRLSKAPAPATRPPAPPDAPAPDNAALPIVREPAGGPGWHAVRACGLAPTGPAPSGATITRRRHARRNDQQRLDVLRPPDPWHGFGAVLDQPPTTIAEAIERSGLGWRVEREPIAIDRRDIVTVDDWWLPRCEQISGWWANVRQDTREVLGIVGERYRIYLQSRVIRRRPRPTAGKALSLRALT